MPITYTGQETNLFLAAALAKKMHFKIVDKTALRPLSVDLGLVNGQGSDTSKVTRVTMDDAMAPANSDEVTVPGDTDVNSDTAVNVVVERQVIVRKPTDKYQLLGQDFHRPGFDLLTKDLGNAGDLRFTDMHAALYSSVSTEEGLTGTDLSIDDISNAGYRLIRARVPGAWFGVLAPIGLTQMMDSLRGEGGSAIFSQETEKFVGLNAMLGYGFHGRFRGVDYWSADSVPTDGGDRESCLYGLGAFGHQDGIPRHILKNARPGSTLSVTPGGSPYSIEFDRDSEVGTDIIVGVLWTGVVELEDERAVKLRHSST